jgi:RNA polymerase primary sigma factor
MLEKIRKMARAYNELSSEFERDPTDEEVARLLGWTPEEVGYAKGAMSKTASLDQPLSAEGDSSELGTLIEDERTSDIPGEVMREVEGAGLNDAIGQLPERYRHVLVRRYGLDERDAATLAELSDELGISRERVRQVQLRAERMLAHSEFGQALRGAAA